MQAKRAAASLLALLALLFTGCWDRAELEDLGYVIGLGIDRGREGSLLVAARVAIMHSGPGGGMTLGGNAPISSALFVAEAESLNKALFILNGAAVRRIDLRHLRAILVGEELAKSGLEPILMEMMRHPTLRESSVFILVRGSMLEVMRKNAPAGEPNPAKMVEGYILQAKQLHLTPPSYLQKFLARLAAPGGDPFLPVAALNPGAGLEAGAPKYSATHSALPGELPRGRGNPVDFVGTAVFRRDRLAGYLSVDETQMLLALRGEMGKAYVSVPDPLHPDSIVTLRFHQENLPQTRAAFVAGKPRVSLRLLFEGELLAAPSGVDYVRVENRQRLEAAAAAFSEKTIRGLLDKLHDWEADPVGFGHKFRKHFATWSDWQAYDWRRHVKDLKVDVTVQMRVRRFGLMTGPDRVEEEK